MLGAASKARGGQPKSSSKNGLKNGLKVERGEEDEDSSDDSDPDDADLDLDLDPQGKRRMELVLDLHTPPVKQSAGAPRGLCTPGVVGGVVRMPSLF